MLPALAYIDRTQDEQNHDDEAKLNWCLRAHGVDQSSHELAAVTGMPINRVLSALHRLRDRGIIRDEGADLWRISRGSLRAPITRC